MREIVKAEYSTQGLKSEQQVRWLKVFSHLSRREAITIGEILAELLPTCQDCGGEGYVDDTHYTNHGEGMVERHDDWRPCRNCEGAGYNVYSAHHMNRSFRVMLDLPEEEGR